MTQCSHFSGSTLFDGMCRSESIVPLPLSESVNNSSSDFPVSRSLRCCCYYRPTLLLYMFRLYRQFQQVCAHFAVSEMTRQCFHLLQYPVIQCCISGATLAFLAARRCSAEHPSPLPRWHKVSPIRCGDSVVCHLALLHAHRGFFSGHGPDTGFRYSDGFEQRPVTTVSIGRSTSL